MSEVNIRHMRWEDIAEVIEIERLSFSSPWTKQAFEKEIANNMYASYYVMEFRGKIVGYCGLWIVIDNAQITNIAILPNYRGKGLGEKLFQYVLVQARNQGVELLSLEVRVSNVRAQKMYRKFGLQPAGIRKNYYQDNNEDALVMWVKL
ncbi:ribosomal protein S18-alanine N-acetyltransferase [Salirhabdus salicampi]|uniref:ribosomal protein S18-alanine N-acetyltransferase n=1 Tax=Salirhabdus salicampi TaxID=476102 RepID=UPI0020C1D3B7|nr:ribosomal protein S18-alanine N-acetyltransferase [Salirhabdus salicampi]MCP8617823.1 ribosomal protein S18-alanine N-acetyltransferase [Salirhabdus salicampi]